jgi:hypothetical protein
MFTSKINAQRKHLCSVNNELITGYEKNQQHGAKIKRENGKEGRTIGC